MYSLSTTKEYGDLRTLLSATLWNIMLVLNCLIQDGKGKDDETD